MRSMYKMVAKTGKTKAPTHQVMRGSLLGLVAIATSLKLETAYLLLAAFLRLRSVKPNTLIVLTNSSAIHKRELLL